MVLEVNLVGFGVLSWLEECGKHDVYCSIGKSRRGVKVEVDLRGSEVTCASPMLGTCALQVHIQPEPQVPAAPPTAPPPSTFFPPRSEDKDIYFE